MTGPLSTTTTAPPTPSPRNDYEFHTPASVLYYCSTCRSLVRYHGNTLFSCMRTTVECLLACACCPAGGFRGFVGSAYLHLVPIFPSFPLLFSLSSCLFMFHDTLQTVECLYISRHSANSRALRGHTTGTRCQLLRNTRVAFHCLPAECVGVLLAVIRLS